MALSRSTRVGLFVLFGIFLVSAAIFLIGDNRSFWDPKFVYTTSFGDVSGLKPGAPVRMGGFDVGLVTDVGHGSSPTDPRIYVKMSIVKSEAVRVHTDTLAHVANKGLLGDKMVELTPGAASAPAAPSGSTLPSEDPTDFNVYLKRFDDISASAQNAIKNVENATQGFADPQFSKDISGTVHSLNDLMDGVAHKDGTAHRLIFDKGEADRVDRLIANLDQSTAQLNATLAAARDVTTQVKNGPGLAHALVYDGDMSSSTVGVLNELHRDMVAVREGNGIAHSIVYGDNDSQHVMSNVNAMSEDLRAIVSGVRQGKGTIGALLVDPSVYEDIKMLVGNVERNEVLRALVRYSIKADEDKTPVEVQKK